ncbi:hypothetical protein EDB89DRAFT_2007667 [Lactarius sanguifluus]|nr:hypothetical protein EDB89DRAFT_2007667 [Lactarius sanguifluus]
MLFGGRLSHFARLLPVFSPCFSHRICPSPRARRGVRSSLARPCKSCEPSSPSETVAPGGHHTCSSLGKATLACAGAGLAR